MSLKLSRLDRTIGLIPWVLAALFGGVALHLIAVLTLPTLAPGSAYRQLAAPLRLGEPSLPPRPAPGDGGSAFADPFGALAICRFNLGDGPLRLRAQGDGDHPLTVSVRLADGAPIFSANDRQTPKGKFDILIVTQAQADAQDEARDKAEQDGEEAAAGSGDELRLISPAKKGFAVFRALSLREGDYAATAAWRSSIQCIQEAQAKETTAK